MGAAPLVEGVARRVRIAVEGTVQGVGFRPYVFRLATGIGLGGFVRNDASGVTIEVEGEQARIDEFLSRLVGEAPSYARVSHVAVEATRVFGTTAFEVATSSSNGSARASIPPDLCTCDACLAELFDPTNRRYRYAFINCTNCGPRFTIAYDVPYDRRSTTMAGFRMCDECQSEYDDPCDRRFHAQPNACPNCGPQPSLVVAGSPREPLVADAIAGAAAAIRGGAIIAVKGLGGYHLACRADDSDVVARLRRRKHRDAKPFALMVRDLDAARSIVSLGALESSLLAGVARPIVIARALPDVRVASGVAPGVDELGVMLPYTPLHHVLLHELDAPIVLTSGNASDEPIAYRDADAMDRLRGLADLFLIHDRPIEARCEDSVARVVRVAGIEQTLFHRRSRGYVPESLPIPAASMEDVLATGSHLKNTVCVVRGANATVGPHAGDLGDAIAYAAYGAGIDHLVSLTRSRPRTIAHDLHPDYASTAYALEAGAAHVVGVQHHHAHFAGCLAEHGETGRAIGLIFDGAGYGADGSSWGGEVLYGDLGEFERLGHLRPVSLPGGDAAAREPWRMACSWLSDAHDDVPSIPPTLSEAVPLASWTQVGRLCRAERATSRTTGVARLLDACAAICGVHPRVTYEGQAAIAFESLARRHRHRNGGPSDVTAETASGYCPTISLIDGAIVIDPRPLILAIERDVLCGRDVGEIASSVHAGLVYAARASVELAMELTGSSTVVLSGGVFQNTLLVEGVSSALSRRGGRVLVPRRLPPNDGGLSYGQAAVAVWRGRGGVPGDSGSSR